MHGCNPRWCAWCLAECVRTLQGAPRTRIDRSDSRHQQRLTLQLLRNIDKPDFDHPTSNDRAARDLERRRATSRRTPLGRHRKRAILECNPARPVVEHPTGHSMGLLQSRFGKPTNNVEIPVHPLWRVLQLAVSAIETDDDKANCRAVADFVDGVSRGVRFDSTLGDKQSALISRQVDTVPGRNSNYYWSNFEPPGRPWMPTSRGMPGTRRLAGAEGVGIKREGSAFSAAVPCTYGVGLCPRLVNTVSQPSFD